MSRPLVILFAAIVVGASSGCESTVDSARKITALGSNAFKQHGISVSAVDRQIRIVGTTILHDSNGAAVVVELRYAGRRTVIGAPITVDVRDRSGKSVYRNDAPGLETDLAHIPLLVPGAQFAWVNDQVLASGTPARVLARIGPGRPGPAAPPPAIEISGVTLASDPVSGVAATGHVRNGSQVNQLHLVLFAVARRGGRIVAAGRAILPRLLAGKSATFHAYFIGNPQGAQISVSAPPSVVG